MWWGKIRDKHQALPHSPSWLPHSTAPTGPGHLQSYSTAKNQRNVGKQRRGWCQAAQPLLPGVLGDGGGIWGWGLEEFEQSLFPCVEQILPPCVSHSYDELVGLCLSEVGVPQVWCGCPGRGAVGVPRVLWVPWQAGAGEAKALGTCLTAAQLDAEIR